MPLLYTSLFAGGGFGPPDMDPNWSQVVLLASFDGADGAATAADRSLSGHTLTFVANAQIDTGQSKFGGSSLLLDGTGDYVIVADSDDFSFGAGDFTIEAFVRPAVTGGFTIVAKYTSSPSTAEWSFVHNGSNLAFFAFNDAGNFIGLSDPVTLNADQWHHLVAERAGDTFRTYASGVVISSLTQAFTLQNTNEPLRIGLRNHPTSLPLNGWIDEVRITKGVARYAGAFTPPTKAFLPR